VVASLLAAIGLYGVIAFTVEQRTKEIGIRIALGARSRDVFRAIAARGAALLLVGLLAGLGASLALTRVLSSMLYSIGRVDGVVFALAAAVMSLIAIAATGVPARRATRVDPIIALRAG